MKLHSSTGIDSASNSAEGLRLDAVAAKWLADGEDVALATVIRVEGSAPLPEGSKMLVTANGKMAGSVSAGCVEAAVADAAAQVLRDGKPQVQHYGIDRDMMWDVGLSCGGAIDVFVQRLAAPLPASTSAYARCTIVQGPRHVGEQLVVDAEGKVDGVFADPNVTRAALQAAREQMASGECSVVPAGCYELFIDVHVPQPHAVLVGAVHIAQALARMAKEAGFAVTVIDPRPALNNRERFADAVLDVAWPDEALQRVTLDNNTYVAVLTHDEKFDDPTLLRALPSRARYVGAIGSKKTQTARRERLIHAGLDPNDVARLHGPIGLAIGAQTPQEIAVAILAEMIAAKNQKHKR